MMYPLVRDFAAKDARIRVPVAVACLVLRFSEQDFYAWLTNPVTGRDWSDAHLTNAAVDLHAEDPGNGYRFIFDERPAHGITASERRVWRLCSQQRLWSLFFQETRPQSESRAARTVPRLSSKKSCPSEHRCIYCQPSPRPAIRCCDDGWDTRVPRTSESIAKNSTIVAIALILMVHQNSALHKRAILLSYSTVDVPTTVAQSIGSAWRAFPPESCRLLRR
ncbi:MAG: transposase [Kineosporiaceae bacterium]|nr:transposase [Aeromicrobium sp.]